MNHSAAVDFTGAMADGQVDLVPADARAHIEGCPDCAAEMQWQREVNVALRGALAQEARAAAGSLTTSGTSWHRRLPPPALLAGIAAAILLVATAGALSLGRHSSSPTGAPGGAEAVLAAAEHAYGTRPAMASSDRGALAAWTASHGMSAMIAPAVSDAALVGLRDGPLPDHPAVTFIYTSSSGPVEVTELAAPAPGDWPMSETRMMGGHAVGMMGHGSDRMIVVAPDEATLARAMSSVQ